MDVYKKVLKGITDLDNLVSNCSSTDGLLETLLSNWESPQREAFERIIEKQKEYYPSVDNINEYAKELAEEITLLVEMMIKPYQKLSTGYKSETCPCCNETNTTKTIGLEEYPTHEDKQ